MNDDNFKELLESFNTSSKQLKVLSDIVIPFLAKLDEFKNNVRVIGDSIITIHATLKEVENINIEYSEKVASIIQNNNNIKEQISNFNEKFEIVNNRLKSNNDLSNMYSIVEKLQTEVELIRTQNNQIFEYIKFQMDNNEMVSENLKDKESKKI